MFLPSPLYLLAITNIADSDDSTSSNVLVAVVICAIGVMVFVEVPVVAMFVRADGVITGVERFRSWLRRDGSTLTAGVALISFHTRCVPAVVYSCSSPKKDTHGPRLVRSG
jgi:hypothetical protein